MCPGQLSWVMALGSRRRGQGLEIRARVGIPVSGTIIYYDTKYSNDNTERTILTSSPSTQLIQLPWSLNFKMQYYLSSLPMIRVAPRVMVAQGNTWPGAASWDTERGEIGIKLSLICNHITLWALSSRISNLKHQQSIEQATLILQDIFSISVKEFGRHSPEFQSLKTGLHQWVFMQINVLS